MISSQVIQKTLDELRAITEYEIFIAMKRKEPHTNAINP